MGLAAGQQAFVTGFGGWFPADRSQSCHVEQAPGLGASSADAAPAAVLAGIAVEGGEAQQRGGLAATEGAEFGHGGTQAGGGLGVEFGTELAQGRELLNQLAAESKQVTE